MKEEEKKSQEDIGKKVEEKIKTWWHRQEERGSRWGKAFEGCFSIIASIIFYVLINTLYDNFSFIKTNDFRSILLVINISIFINIVLNILLIIIRRKWYKSLMTIANNAFSFINTLLFLVVFPFDFTGHWNFLDTVLKVVFVVALFGIVVSTILESIRFVKYSLQGK